MLSIPQILSTIYRKNICQDIPTTIAGHKVSLMNFEPGVPETAAQHAVWKFKCDPN